MYLSGEFIIAMAGIAVWLLSLVVCLILLMFPRFRNPRRPAAWPVWFNLSIAALLLLSFTAARVQEWAFETVARDYRIDPSIAEIRSFHIEDVRQFARATYGCFASWSSSSCSPPIEALIVSGRVDFIEIGRDPVLRYEMHFGDQECLSEKGTPSSLWSIPRSFPVVPALGSCVLASEVDRPASSHVFRIEEKRQSYPSRRPYLKVLLEDRKSGRLLAEFDGWHTAKPYFLSEETASPRRPDGLLGELIRVRPAGDGRYDREMVDGIAEKYGFSEDILIEAATSSYQSYRASAIWLACRDAISTSLSEEVRQVLVRQSVGLFSNAPDWTYPESCPEWAR